MTNAFATHVINTIPLEKCYKINLLSQKISWLVCEQITKLTALSQSLIKSNQTHLSFEYIQPVKSVFFLVEKMLIINHSFKHLGIRWIQDLKGFLFEDTNLIRITPYIIKHPLQYLSITNNHICLIIASEKRPYMKAFA